MVETKDDGGGHEETDQDSHDPIDLVEVGHLPEVTTSWSSFYRSPHPWPLLCEVVDTPPVHSSRGPPKPQGATWTWRRPFWSSSSSSSSLTSRRSSCSCSSKPPPPPFRPDPPLSGRDVRPRPPFTTSDSWTGPYGTNSADEAWWLENRSSSLLFPTRVQASNTAETPEQQQKRRIESAWDQCARASRARCCLSSTRRKKTLLNLSHLKLTASNLPLEQLCDTPGGQTLHTLCLAGNRLGSLPGRWVQSWPALKHLDLSQCELTQLPERWHLPQLSVLNLRLNRLIDFPPESVLEGLPELRELNLYGNKIAVLTLPHSPLLLAKLEVLDLGYNELMELPPDLDQVRSLRILRVMNNYLTTVPRRVCDINLTSMDLSMNPVTQWEACEQGRAVVRRPWQAVRLEGPVARGTRAERVLRHLEHPKKKQAPKREGYTSKSRWRL